MSELQRLRDRVEELEDLAGMGDDDVSLLRQATGLTLAQCKILGVIRKRRRIAPRQMIHGYVYGGRPECDQPDIKIIDVLISQARKKLRPLGIEIETGWGTGYQMTEPNRTALTALMESHLVAA